MAPEPSLLPTPRLRTWGDGVFRFAFGMPLLCGFLTVWLAQFPQMGTPLSLYTTLPILELALFWLCGGVGLITFVLGYAHRSHRLLLQGGFTLSVFMALFCIGYYLGSNTPDPHGWWHIMQEAFFRFQVR